MAIGKKIWAIAEGYIPGYSNGPPPDFISHEAACILNTSDEDAHVQIMLYFADKEPVGPYHVTVPARRTKHLRFNNLTDPQPVPLETDYSSVFISDQPIVLQYTRLDSRQNANALITTIAYTE
ncbi:MAG TPA: sensory rhodopsin transducer [Hanamia sp.]